MGTLPREMEEFLLFLLGELLLLLGLILKALFPSLERVSPCFNLLTIYPDTIFQRREQALVKAEKELISPATQMLRWGHIPAWDLPLLASLEGAEPHALGVFPPHPLNQDLPFSQPGVPVTWDLLLSHPCLSAFNRLFMGCQ